MYHVGEGTRPCPFSVTGNGRVTEPQGDHFRGRNLGMIPKRLTDGERGKNSGKHSGKDGEGALRSVAQKNQNGAQK